MSDRTSRRRQHQKQPPCLFDDQPLANHLQRQSQSQSQPKARIGGTRLGVICHAGPSYFFIRPDAREGKEDADVFLHAAQVKRARLTSLAVGQRICFDLKESRSRKGDFEARNIALAEAA
jgi:cold shock CspA family protein